MSTSLIPSQIENVVEIDWYAESDHVVVTPKNQQRFIIQKDAAIEALRQAKAAERFELQFDLLLQVLGKWLHERTSAVESGIVTLQDNSLVFVVVQSKVAYDEQLQDDLAGIDVAIAQDASLDLIKLRTVLLPPVGSEALGTFLDPRMVLRYTHGK